MITVASLVPPLGGALALSGVAVAVSRRRELRIRWCAWAVGVPLVTGAFRLGRPGAGAVAGLGALAALSALSWPAAVAVAVGGPAGDLLESMVKRGARVKDAGHWLPGSGGLLDRVDSLLVALAVLLVLS